MTVALVCMYLAAIVAANFSSAHFGPSASIYNAFALIGLDLTTRDRLHDAWLRHRWRNMALLIATGSAVSYGAAVLLASDTLPSSVVAKIAFASCVAFASAESADALLYQVLLKRGWLWLERVNTSNILSAAIDSAVFVSIAFGFRWPIIFGQFCAKVAGGFLWSMILKRRQRREVVAV